MRWPRLVPVVTAAAGICLALLAAAQHGPPVQRPTTIPTAPGASAAATPPDLAPTPAASRVPLRLVIPRIGVDAAVEQIGLDSQSRMGVPRDPVDVAWYSPGPAPGEPGDAVIDGHLDWYDLPRAVFSDLGRLRPGDEIRVVSSSGLQRFAVTGTETVQYTAQPPGLFDPTGEPRLSLITCSGSWDSRHGTYAQRLVVNARSLGPG